MWKPLYSTQKVYPGDKIRFIHPGHKETTDTLFKVVKTDEHWFEILPDSQDCDDLQSLTAKKVVRYFDIGYNIEVDVWNEESV